MFLVAIIRQHQPQEFTSSGQQRLPWAWDIRFNQIPEDRNQVAIKFRRANGILDGDIQFNFILVTEYTKLLTRAKKLMASFVVPSNCWRLSFC